MKQISPWNELTSYKTPTWTLPSYIILLQTGFWSYDCGSTVRGTENFEYCMLSCDFRIKCYSNQNP
jgi:hypothetical protein